MCLNLFVCVPLWWSSRRWFHSIPRLSFFSSRVNESASTIHPTEGDKKANNRKGAEKSMEQVYPASDGFFLEYTIVEGNIECMKQIGRYSPSQPPRRGGQRRMERSDIIQGIMVTMA